MKGSKGKVENKDFKTAAGFAAGGSMAAASIAAMIGNMGLAGGFGAIAAGATPVVGAGVTVGMAAYGIKKLFE